MKFKIFIQDTAKEDIREATDYYKNINIDLAKRYIFKLKKSINLIQSNPEGYSIRYKNTRMSVLKVFPYVIHFEFEKPTKSIYILAVFYGGENPNKWV